MTTTKKLTLVCILAAGLTAASASATERSTVLGGDGAIYQGKVGAYKELFPKGGDTAPSNTVVALEITQAGGTVQRVLVPYTKNADVERSPAVLFEDVSKTVFLVWEAPVDALKSTLMLASFDGERWSAQPILITGNPYSSKSSPRLAVTRDTFPVAGQDGATTQRTRTILHIVWTEDADRGNYEVLYSPVILEEGTYLGWHPVYRLSQLASSGQSGSEFAPPLDLLVSPIIQHGSDGRTVVVGFAYGAERRINTVVIDVLPEELGQLSETARSNIIDIGRGRYPADRQGLAQAVQQKIIEHGGAFHADAIAYIAERVFNQIMADRGGNDDDLIALGEAARSNIIDIGASFSGRGLRDRGRSDKARIEQVDYPDPKPAGTAPHLIQMRVVSSRPTPQVGTANLRLFLSDNGEEALIAWTEKDRVVYRLSQDDSWATPREIKLSDSVTLEKAYQILEQRVRNR